MPKQLYRPGQSGNPNGKVKGTKNKRSQLAKLLEPHANELINKAVEMAKNGDSNSLRLCIERLIPKAKNETVNITPPNGSLTEPKALLEFGAEILRAVSNQELTPEQGKIISDIIESQRRNIEISNLFERVIEIENTLKNRTNN
jgi:hypothetical protein